MTSDFTLMLAPLKLKDLFYVIRRSNADCYKYVRQSTGGNPRGFGGDAEIGASTLRFNSVLEAAQRINERNAAYPEFASDPFEIVRVEAITTPGKSTRVEVPLGDKRQTGVAIKAHTEYWTGDIKSKYSSLINSARVFESVSRALGEAQRAAADGMIPIARGDFVGIAFETTPSTTTYTETVLA